jgi:hypothetical protein
LLVDDDEAVDTGPADGIVDDAELVVEGARVDAGKFVGTFEESVADGGVEVVVYATLDKGDDIHGFEDVDDGACVMSVNSSICDDCGTHRLCPE